MIMVFYICILKGWKIVIKIRENCNLGPICLLIYDFGHLRYQISLLVLHRTIFDISLKG